MGKKTHLHDAGGNKIVHPADASRKQAKKRWREQKAQRRKKFYEGTLLQKSPELIEAEIMDYKDLQAAGKLTKAKKDKMTREIAAYGRLKDEIKSRHQKRLDAQKADCLHVDFEELKVHRKASIFYHPVTNPYGAPPPGQSLAYRHPDGSVKREPPPAGAPLPEVADAGKAAADGSSEEEDEDDDDEAMGGSDKGDDEDEDDDDDDDEEPLLPDSLPSTMPPGFPPGMSQNLAGPALPPGGLLPPGPPGGPLLQGMPLGVPMLQPGLPHLPPGLPPLPPGLPPGVSQGPGLPLLPPGLPPLPPGPPPGLPPDMATGMLPGMLPGMPAGMPLGMAPDMPLGVPPDLQLGLPAAPPLQQWPCPQPGASRADFAAQVHQLGFDVPGLPPAPPPRLPPGPPPRVRPGPPQEPVLPGPPPGPPPKPPPKPPPQPKPAEPKPALEGAKAKERAPPPPPAKKATPVQPKAATFFTPTTLRSRKPSQVAGGVLQVSSASLSQEARKKVLSTETPTVTEKVDVEDAFKEFMEGLE